MDTFITELTAALQNAVPLFVAYSVAPAWVATIIIPLLIVLIKHGFKNFKTHRVEKYETVTIYEMIRHINNEYYPAVSHYLINVAKLRSNDSLAHAAASSVGVSQLNNVMSIDRQKFVFEGIEIHVYTETKESPYNEPTRSICLQSEKKADVFRFAEYARKHYHSIKNKGSIGEHHYNDAATWNHLSMYVTKTFDNVFLDPKLRQHLLDEIDGFMSSEQFYKERGIAYRRGYLMHGPHGCGKTSVINAISNRTGFEIRSIHLGRIKDGGMLRKVAQGIPPSSIVVLEDLDCISVTHKRKQIKLTAEACQQIMKEMSVVPDCECPGLVDLYHKYYLREAPEDLVEQFEEQINNNPANAHAFLERIRIRDTVPGGVKDVDIGSVKTDSLNLADLLDLLDSNTFLYKTIVIITSNHPEKFDPALIRPGRVDTSFEFRPAGEALVHMILKSFYPDIPDELLPKIKTTIPQSTLISSIIVPNRKDYRAALSSLRTLVSV